MYKSLKNSFLVLLMLSFYSCDILSDNGNADLVANAGEDQTTIVGSYAIFDPTKSTGNIEWYEWEQDENNPSTVKIYSHSKQPKDEWDIHKIIFIKEGIYRFILTVKTDYNDSRRSEPDTLVITVNSNPNSLFEDPNLEGMIRSTLNIQVDNLDESRLLELDSLQYSSLSPDPVSSLEGLEHCKNLTYLHLGSQNISDISPLTTLTKLKNLWLDQNRKISDVTPLKDLTELEELNLDSNLLIDISPLKNLVKLKFLNLQLNPIEDISAIQNMKELQKLEFFRAFLADISSLANLSNLHNRARPVIKPVLRPCVPYVSDHITCNISNVDIR